MKRIKLIFIIVVCVFMVFTAACGQTVKKGGSDKQVELLISAAASLKDSLSAVGNAFEEKHPNIKLVFSFGSSGALQQQIENGAAVDVFISAATKQMDSLNEKGLIVGDTRREFLKNELVLIVPKEEKSVSGFEDLTSEKIQHISLGEPKGVPAGQYAQEMLTKLGIIDQIKNKFVYGNDVKEVLTWVETGDADAGIVYATDARSSQKVRVVAKAPEDSHKPIYYPAAVIKETKNPDEAKAFTEFLYGSEAKPIFEKYGFVFMEK